jgi:hypothetical protein
MYVIYALTDPRDGKVHYVGMTDNVYKRFQDHIQCSGRNFDKNAWILSMREANVMVQMLELERVEDLGRARVREAYWVNHYAELGHPLANIQRSVLRLIYKILVRSSGARSPKAAIVAIENGLSSVAGSVSEEQVETEAMISPAQPPVAQRDVSSEDRPKEYRLTETEIGQFLAAYRVGGSIDKALAATGDGKGARYRQHAREILAAHNARQA